MSEKVYKPINEDDVSEKEEAGLYSSYTVIIDIFHKLDQIHPLKRS